MTMRGPNLKNVNKIIFSQKKTEEEIWKDPESRKQKLDTGLGSLPATIKIVKNDEKTQQPSRLQILKNPYTSKSR